MGMFDYIHCKFPLPKINVNPPSALFQTKDTPSQTLSTYTITKGGKLVFEGATVSNFSGDIDFYNLVGTYNKVEGWWEYRAHFINGSLTAIGLVESPDWKPRGKQ